MKAILSRLEELIVTIALILGTALTFIEVVLRYGFGASLGFTHELVVYLLILTGLIGASIGVREKVHIGVDIVIQQFPYNLQKSAKIFSYLLCIFFCTVITILGIQHVQILSSFGLVSPEMEIPMHIPKSIVPIAFGLMTVRFVQELIKTFKTPAHEVITEEGDEYVNNK